MVFLFSDMSISLMLSSFRSFPILWLQPHVMRFLIALESPNNCFTSLSVPSFVDSSSIPAVITVDVGRENILRVLLSFGFQWIHYQTILNSVHGI